MVTKVILFDVDGTLIRTRGAGVRAMALAFEEIFGIEDGLDGVEMAGRIDTVIFRNALRKHGLSADNFPDQVRRFHDAYCRHLAVTLPQATGHVLPGVREMLTVLHPRPDVRLGLVTGNFRRSAEMKLAYFDLWRFFEKGAFGEDREDRGELVALAMRRMGGDSAVYVIGDTVYDVEAAKANGAISVAVNTGGTTAEELRAAGPDLLFPDFSDWQAVLTAFKL